MAGQDPLAPAAQASAVTAGGLAQQLAPRLAGESRAHVPQPQVRVERAGGERRPVRREGERPRPPASWRRRTGTSSPFAMSQRWTMPSTWAEARSEPSGEKREGEGGGVVAGLRRCRSVRRTWARSRGGGPRGGWPRRRRPARARRPPGDSAASFVARRLAEGAQLAEGRRAAPRAGWRVERPGQGRPARGRPVGGVRGRGGQDACASRSGRGPPWAAPRGAGSDGGGRAEPLLDDLDQGRRCRCARGRGAWARRAASSAPERSSSVSRRRASAKLAS